MYVLAFILFALAVVWLVVVVRRVLQVNRRLRSNLAGCTGYPVKPSFRRPDVPSVPLRSGQSRAAERVWGSL